MMTPMKRIWLGFRKEITILQYERGLLYRAGRLERVLEPGRYRFGRWAPVEVAKISLREMSHIVAGQGLLTADKIEVRITLVAQYRVTDPTLAFQAVENYVEQLHQELQLALRDVVSAKTMDQLLESRAELGNELLQLAVEPARRYGVELTRVGLRDVILPREVQRVLMLEVEADRTGRAELVKARHEVAAARARANTAKILAESPEVVRLQQLDALLALAGKGGNVVLLPNLADLLTPRKNGSV